VAYVCNILEESCSVSGDLVVDFDLLLHISFLGPVFLCTRVMDFPF